MPLYWVISTIMTMVFLVMLMKMYGSFVEKLLVSKWISKEEYKKWYW